MANDLKIQICSDVDYQQLIAEIYCDEEFVALLSQEQGENRLLVEFPEASNVTRKVELDWLLNALNLAKSKLLAKKSMGAN